MSEHLDYLDGWRGMAILFLLIGHFLPVPGINLGAIGVDLFFVLSGLLMAKLLFVEHVPLARFYRRRIARIVPAALAFLLLVVLAALADGRALPWPEVLAAATFTNNYFPAPAGLAVMPFGHIWSLSVEEHSYILLSLIAVGARRGLYAAGTAVAVCAALFAACGLYYWIGYGGGAPSAARAMRTEVAAYGIFASGALLLLLRGLSLPRLPLAACPALLLAGIALHWWSIPLPVRTVCGVGLMALAVNLLAAAPARLHAVLTWRPLRQLGLWSFSLYLWQQPFYLALGRPGLDPAPALGLAVAAGLASFYLIERPARRWLNGAAAAPSMKILNARID